MAGVPLTNQQEASDMTGLDQIRVTFDDKKRIARIIEELPGEELSQVLTIVRTAEPDKVHSAGGMTSFQVDSLRPSTIAQLVAFLNVSVEHGAPAIGTAVTASNSPPAAALDDDVVAPVPVAHSIGTGGGAGGGAGAGARGAGGSMPPPRRGVKRRAADLATGGDDDDNDDGDGANVDYEDNSLGIGNSTAELMSFVVSSSNSLGASRLKPSLSEDSSLDLQALNQRIGSQAVAIKRNLSGETTGTIEDNVLDVNELDLLSPFDDIFPAISGDVQQSVAIDLGNVQNATATAKATWSCPSCTIGNEMTNATCIICGTSKPHEGSATRPNNTFKLHVEIVGERKRAANGMWKCTHCPKEFKTRSDLVPHIRVHTGEKPYVCSHPGCKKRFAHSSNVRAHERTHKGVKPYQCNWPGCKHAGFAHPSSLRDHMHKHEGIRPYACDFPGCDSTFTAVANLARHKKLHKKHGGLLPGQLRRLAKKKRQRQRRQASSITVAPLMARTASRQAGQAIAAAAAAAMHSK